MSLTRGTIQGYIGNVDFYQQEKPYIAVVKDGAGIGRTTLHPAKSSVIGTMQYLLPKENVLPEYLYYVVRYMHLEKYFTGATIPHIYFKDYKNEQFNLDPLDVQKQIVNILGKCEKIISDRQRELANLDDLIKARFVELTESVNTVATRMGDIATYINGYAFKPTDWTESGLPIIRIQNLNDANAKYNYFDGEIDSKYLVTTGDVLVSWATHLEAYIWDGNSAWLNQHIFKALFDKMPVNKLQLLFSAHQISIYIVSKFFAFHTRSLTIMSAPAGSFRATFSHHTPDSEALTFVIFIAHFLYHCQTI